MQRGGLNFKIFGKSQIKNYPNSKLIPADTTNGEGSRLSIVARVAAEQEHVPSVGLAIVVLGTTPKVVARIWQIVGRAIDISLHQFFLGW